MKTKVVEYIGRIQDGGAESIVRDYALTLNKYIFDVYIVCRDYKKESNVYKTLINNNVKIITLYPKFNIFHRFLARILGAKYVSNKFAKVINNIKPNVIHCHLECLETVYYAKNYLDNIKLLFTCHNLPELCIGKNRPREHKACKYLIKNNNLHIIALHDEMAKEINSMFNINDTIVIKNGINFAKYRNIIETKDEIKQSFNIPRDAYIIGQIGRYDYQKNQDFSIKIFKKLLEEKPNSYLLLIGRGKDEKKIKSLIKKYNIQKNVLLLKNRDDIPRLLKMMDVFLFPSRYEGLGIVLIEAQVMGLPCLVSENIPQEAFQSKNIVKLNLNDPINNWINSLLNPVCNINNFGNINDYDIKYVVRKLEREYLI